MSKYDLGDGSLSFIATPMAYRCSVRTSRFSHVPHPAGVSTLLGAENSPEVPVIGLDRVLDEFDQVSLLKLDCEGAEWAILRTAQGLSKVAELIPDELVIDLFEETPSDKLWKHCGFCVPPRRFREKIRWTVSDHVVSRVAQHFIQRSLTATTRRRLSITCSVQHCRHFAEER